MSTIKPKARKSRVIPVGFEKIDEKIKEKENEDKKKKTN
jgi:hypothetical protein